MLEEKQNFEKEQSLVVPIPGKRLQKITTGFLLLLVLLASAILFYLSFKNQNKKLVINKLPQTIQKPDYIVSAQDIAIFESKASLLLPKISSSEPISTSTIPKELSVFITDSPQNLQSLKVQFQSGQSGYRLIYGVSKTIEELRFLFNNPKDWNIKDEFLTDHAALWTFEGNGLNVQIVETFLNTSTTRVSIVAVKK